MAPRRPEMWQSWGSNKTWPRFACLGPISANSLARLLNLTAINMWRCEGVEIKMSLHVLARRLSSKSLQIVLYARNSMLALEMRIVRKHAHPFVEAHLVRGSVGRLWLLLVTTRANVLDTAATTASLREELVLELTVLVVTVGLLERDGNDVEDIGALLEDVVHLLEGSVAGFGEEEVGHWEDEGVDDREDCCAVSKWLI